MLQDKQFKGNSLLFDNNLFTNLLHDHCTISGACPWLAFNLDPADLYLLGLVIRWKQFVAIWQLSTYKDTKDTDTP